MELTPYLAHSEIIDWQQPDVLALAQQLAEGSDDPEQIAKRCFEWVRDEIPHSWDARKNPLTCSASEVLAFGTGYCYAKSHLLAALLRANQIPCGFCYQRLSLEENGAPYTLHGLNAVYLPKYGWYRIDARGNKAGVNAQFTPPTEQLAFAINERLERDLPEIWPAPLPVVVEVLQNESDIESAYRNLPDIELLGH